MVVLIGFDVGCGLVLVLLVSCLFVGIITCVVLFSRYCCCLIVMVCLRIWFDFVVLSMVGASFVVLMS